MCTCMYTQHPPHTHIHPCALGSPLANLSSFRQAHISLSSDLQFMVCLHLLPPRRRYQRTNLDCCQHCGFVSQIRAWSLLSPTGWNKEGAVMVSPGPKPSLDLCMYCNCASSSKTAKHRHAFLLLCPCWLLPPLSWGDYGPHLSIVSLWEAEGSSQYLV